MSIESRRSLEQAGEGSRENRREQQEHRDRPSDVPSTAERGSVTPDTAAIDVARLNVEGIYRQEPPEPPESREARKFQFLAKRFEGETMLDKDRKIAAAIAGASIGFVSAGSAAVLMGFGKPLAIGSLAAVGGYLACKARSLSAVDWLARKMDGLANKMIDKKLPVPLRWVVNPTVILLDGAAKWLGLDKSLAEHLKKNPEARKKLADKVFKEYMATQTKAEKKLDDASEKAKRRKVIEEKFGSEVADAIWDDVDAAAAAAGSKSESAPAPAPAETPKVA